MYRGTTPRLVFRFDNEVDLSDITALWITIKNKLGTKSKTYGLEDAEIDDDEDTIALELTQEDTLYFSEGELNIQIRVKNSDDAAYASNIVKTTMKRILKEGEI